MRANGNFIEIDSFQKNKAGNIVCGDCFMSQKRKEEGRIISVLSDGLGSGIKASVLSTMTATMSVNFAAMNEDILFAARSILNTLPKDRIRRISYATFCMCDIDCFGNARIVEYETPPFCLWRNGEFIDVPKRLIPIEREGLGDTVLQVSEFPLQKEDRIVFFSDGVSQSGMGTERWPLGWENGVREFIAGLIGKNPELSAKELAHKIVLQAERNDGFSLKDDTTCCAVYMRKPRNLIICTGPPYDEKNDRLLATRLDEFAGKKIICGGTTARIVARELNRTMEIDLDSVDKSLPPVSRMEGIDLVTEGILTLSKVERLLAAEAKEYLKELGPAEQIVRYLLNSDKITFFVGTKINTAHQDPTLPVELEIRRNVIKKIKELLETKYLKDIEIIYL